MVLNNFTEPSTALNNCTEPLMVRYNYSELSVVLHDGTEPFMVHWLPYRTKDGSANATEPKIVL